MDPRLLDYYNRELLYIREMGGEFAREFPKIAGRLGLDEFECADPYVERLLEGFAFMAARVHLKLDAEFPKFTDHLFEMVYPDYLSPTPSMAIVQFEPDRLEGSLQAGFKVERGTSLRSLLGPGDQTACEYRTSQSVTLWPISIEEASYASRDSVAARLPASFQSAKALLRIRLRTFGGVNFSEIPIDSLRFYLRGRDARTMLLYEQIFSGALSVVTSWDSSTAGSTSTAAAVLDGAILPVGFQDDEALLRSSPKSFQGYRLLQEYFAFPQRFLFFDLVGLRKALAGCRKQVVDLLIPFRRLQNRLENVIDASNFALYCSPAINLFPLRADRIHISDYEQEYHIVPDRTRPMDFEVHSIDGVTGYDSRSELASEFAPFYSMTDQNSQADDNSTFYSVRRMLRQLSSKQRRKGPRTSYVGSESYLSIVDSQNAPFSRNLSQLDIKVQCTNRDLPLIMPVGKSITDFTLETGAPVKSIRCLAGPTEPKPSLAALSGDRSWKLISHLALNYLSITDGESGVSALKELLSLYQSVDDSGGTKKLDGLVRVDSAPIVRRISQRGPLTFGRGLEITLTCDESRFEGSGAFLLGAVLSDFFSKYVSINSFTQTVLRTIDRGEVMRWPLNLGRRQIL